MKNIFIISIIILFASCNAKKDFNSKSVELNNKATQKIMVEDYPYALNLLNEAIKLDSSYYTAYNNKINVLTSLKRYDEAIETNKLLLNHKPDLAEGHFFLGLLFEIQGDTINAQKSYRNALKIFQERISKGEMIESNKMNLALTYKFLGNEEKANNLFKQFLTSDKNRETINLFYKSSKEDILKQLLQK